MEMITTAVIGGGILAYAVYVIRKKVKDIKEGRYCQCGCEGCKGSCKKSGSTR